MRHLWGVQATQVTDHGPCRSVARTVADVIVAESVSEADELGSPLAGTLARDHRPLGRVERTAHAGAGAQV